MHTGFIHQICKIITPRNSHGNVSNCIFHQEIPANDPCKYFTEGNIRIGIGAAGDGNGGSKLSITKRCKSTGNCSKNIKKNHPGTTIVRGFADAAENTSTYYCCDAHSSEIFYSQYSLQMSRMAFGIA